MAFASVVILSSILEPPVLNISTIIPESLGALPDLVVFSAVDTMLCVTCDGGPSNNGSSNIAASQGNSILSKHL